MIETVKNIAAIIGCILSVLTLLGIIAKPLRVSLIGYIKSQAGKSETDRQLIEIHTMLQHHIDDDKVFKQRMEDSMSITLDFTEKQCRNLIKDKFYKYRSERKLPLYEKKTLLDIEDLYINRMHKNHWCQTLINEMNAWPIDYSGEDMDALEEED
ncbi:hypothetical protein SDC9_50567 [bioreactor metagenome]|uniref:Uncharacterized protein n=1 Tax=bioreactor metagenome TaxID=1076179 RepID=A0A644WL57_9ZZZZ